MAKKKKSLREKMKEKKKELESRGNSNQFVEYLKEEGTYRVRLLPPVDDDAEFIQEVTSFYLGKDLGSAYSPVSIGEPCALMEAYNELKESNDEEDQEMAKNMSPRTSYLAPVIFYKDSKGKKVDDDRSGKLLKISKTSYQQIIDLYLDEDEWGDLTDPKNGYDIKITRTGKGKNDTSYDVKPCKNSPLPKSWRKPVDLDEMVKNVLATYDETVEKRDKYLGLEPDEDEDEKPKKKKSSKKSSSKSSKSSKNGKSKKEKSKKKKGDI